MQSTKKATLFASVRSLTLAAMLTAMSVVIGIFCKSFLDFGGVIRITFENLPIILSGILFGPITGGLVGASTDLISYFLSSQAYPPNLIVTLGAAAIGFTSGLVSKYIIKSPSYKQIILSSAVAHVIGSMIIKSIGLYVYFGHVFTVYAILWRIPLYLAIAPTEIMLICLLYKNTALRKILDTARIKK